VTFDFKHSFNAPHKEIAEFSLLEQFYGNMTTSKVCLILNWNGKSHLTAAQKGVSRFRGHGQCTNQASAELGLIAATAGA
jgi:hypothetical protein